MTQCAGSGGGCWNSGGRERMGMLVENVNGNGGVHTVVLYKDVHLHKVERWLLFHSLI